VHDVSRHEAPEVGAACRRMVRALVRRAGDGDTEALEQLAGVADMARDAVGVAVGQLTGFGYSYGDLARLTGLTRQALQQREARAENSPHAEWLLAVPPRALVDADAWPVEAAEDG
jgi:hypothetical protein